MNTKFTIAYGDTRTESRLTFVSSKLTFYDYLTSEGYKVTKWELGEVPTYVEYDGDLLPTGRYFKLLKSAKTNEPETDEVVFG